MAMKSEGSRPVVYICGHQGPSAAPTWYSIDVDSVTTSSTEEQRLPYFFELQSHRGGSWTIMGEDIYYIGGMHDIVVKHDRDRDRDRKRKRLCRDEDSDEDSDSDSDSDEDITPQVITEIETTGNLLRYNTASDCTNPSWKSVSSARQYPLYSPKIFSPIGSNLYVLGGGEHFEDDCVCPHWGEIYDLHSKTWKPLKIDVDKHGPFLPFVSAVLENPTRFLLYCTLTGRILFYDVNKDEVCIQSHPDFVLSDCLVPPKGLDNWYTTDIVDHATYTASPMVDGSTLYWFANDIRLYGYDLLDKRWFRSQSLETELWKPQHLGCYMPPMLVNLLDGRFLLIALKSSGKLAMASLSVDKEYSSFTLNVRVKSLHTLLVDRSFFPHQAALMLKDSGAGTMHGQSNSGLEN